MSPRAVIAAVSLAVLVVAVTVTVAHRGQPDARLEASVVLGGADLRFNPDRFGRIIPALLREQNSEVADGRTALPIEGTRLVRVTARSDDPDEAIRSARSLARDVERVLDGSNLGRFDVVGDAQVVRLSNPRPLTRSVAIGAGTSLLLATAILGLVHAWRSNGERHEVSTIGARE